MSFVQRLFVVCAATVWASGAQAAFETRATAAFLYDVTTGTVLFEKNAEAPLPPASMSKLMTLYMLFEALADGRVTLDEEFAVSTRAKNMGGSTMFLNELDKPTVEELIQGIVVSSGNDATVVVAEGLSGTEDAFARLMNQRAPEIGLTSSTFTNASGWPDAGHRMSVRDLGILAVRLIEDFPEYYGYFAQQEFDYKDRSPANRFNRNPVLAMDIGADGLKTGHTQEAGYGLVGSALQGERRVVFVVTGLDTVADRSQESRQIVNWGFRQFVESKVAEKGEVIAEAGVWMGDVQSINLVAADDISLLVPAANRDALSARVEYRGPLEAPIAEGQEVAELVINVEDLPEKRIALVADRDVIRGGFLPRVRSAVTILLRKGLEQAATFGG
ncbi:MAG: D-alanyl-D-alanine carboxypeptidase family protein [Pseudomonadota bacterium]